MKRKYKQWTVKELNTLKELAHQGYSVKEISIKMNRPTYCVYKQLHRNRIKYKRRLPNGNIWNEEEHRYLIENHKKYTLEELAGKLGRSYNSVMNKLYQLGLNKSWY
jgi:IS30 family transposase